MAKSVFASFGYGESETMAMWGLYYFPRNEAVRISLPRKLIREWLTDTKLKHNEDVILLSDVIYVSNPESKERQFLMRWNNKKSNAESMKDKL